MKEAQMRMSLLKALGFSITALVLGGALAMTPAFARGGPGGDVAAQRADFHVGLGQRGLRKGG